MKFFILSSFPEAFPGALGLSLANQALRNNIWSYEVVNIRDFGIGKHKKIDDEPYGGGNGLVIRADVLGKAIDSVLEKNSVDALYYLSPSGLLFNQKLARSIVNYKNIMLICGRFEGIDERIIERYDICEISIGDYILSGGELAAMVVMDTCIRMLPGVLKNAQTLKEESFEDCSIINGMLEYPSYTRPYDWRGLTPPKVLLSGHHNNIRSWRVEASMKKTLKNRPDLLKS